METESSTAIGRRYQTEYGETLVVCNTILRWVNSFNSEENV